MANTDFDEFEELAAIPEEMDEETIEASKPQLVEDEPEAHQEAEPEAEASAPEAASEDETPLVPSHRLREETERRRVVESELQELQAWRRNLENRFAASQQPQQAEEAPALPDPQEDIFGAVEDIQARQAQIQERQAQDDTVRQQQANFNRFKEVVTRAENEYRAAEPDYDQAYQYHRGIKLNEYQKAGFTQDQALNRLAADEQMISRNALQNRRNPADAIFQAANYLGFQNYKKQAMEQQQAAQAGQAGQAKLDKIAQAQEANETLSTAGGTPTNGAMDLDTLNKLTQEEYNTWIEKKGNRAAFDRLMGK